MNEDIKNIFLFIFVIVFAVFICWLYTTYFIKKDDTFDTEIKTNIKYIESVQKKNDSLVIDINKLDSIKNAKIIEVQTTDNDSIIKLFYELVRE